MNKKLLCVLLCVLMVFQTLAVTAWARTETRQSAVEPAHSVVFDFTERESILRGTVVENAGNGSGVTVGDVYRVAINPSYVDTGVTNHSMAYGDRDWAMEHLSKATYGLSQIKDSISEKRTWLEASRTGTATVTGSGVWKRYLSLTEDAYNWYVGSADNTFFSFTPDGDGTLIVMAKVDMSNYKTADGWSLVSSTLPTEVDTAEKRKALYFDTVVDSGYPYFTQVDGFTDSWEGKNKSWDTEDGTANSTIGGLYNIYKYEFESGVKVDVPVPGVNADPPAFFIKWADRAPDYNYGGELNSLSYSFDGTNYTNITLEDGVYEYNVDAGWYNPNITFNAESKYLFAQVTEPNGSLDGVVDLNTGLNKFYITCDEGGGFSHTYTINVTRDSDIPEKKVYGLWSGRGNTYVNPETGTNYLPSDTASYSYNEGVVETVTSDMARFIERGLGASNYVQWQAPLLYSGAGQFIRRYKAQGINSYFAYDKTANKIVKTTGASTAKAINTNYLYAQMNIGNPYYSDHYVSERYGDDTFISFYISSPARISVMREPAATNSHFLESGWTWGSSATTKGGSEGFYKDYPAGSLVKIPVIGWNQTDTEPADTDEARAEYMIGKISAYALSKYNAANSTSLTEVDSTVWDWIVGSDTSVGGAGGTGKAIIPNVGYAISWDPYAVGIYWLDDNADLSTLSYSIDGTNYTNVTGFDADTLTYNVEVPSIVNTVYVSGTAASANAVSVVGGEVALGEGATPGSVTVTAQGLNTKTYTINFTKEASNVSISYVVDGVETPLAISNIADAAYTHRYTVTLPWSAYGKSVTLKAAASEGTTLKAAESGYDVADVDGDYNITFTALASNKTYIIESNNSGDKDRYTVRFELTAPAVDTSTFAFTNASNTLGGSFAYVNKPFSYDLGAYSDRMHFTINNVGKEIKEAWLLTRQEGRNPDYKGSDTTDGYYVKPNGIAATDPLYSFTAPADGKIIIVSSYNTATSGGFYETNGYTLVNNGSVPTVNGYGLASNVSHTMKATNFVADKGDVVSVPNRDALPYDVRIPQLKGSDASAEAYFVNVKQALTSANASWIDFYTGNSISGGNYYYQRDIALYENGDIDYKPAFADTASYSYPSENNYTTLLNERYPSYSGTIPAVLQTNYAYAWTYEFSAGDTVKIPYYTSENKKDDHALVFVKWGANKDAKLTSLTYQIDGGEVVAINSSNVTNSALPNIYTVTLPWSAHGKDITVNAQTPSGITLSVGRYGSDVTALDTNSYTDTYNAIASNEVYIFDASNGTDTRRYTVHFEITPPALTVKTDIDASTAEEGDIWTEQENLAFGAGVWLKNVPVTYQLRDIYPDRPQWSPLLMGKELKDSYLLTSIDAARKSESESESELYKDEYLAQHGNVLYSFKAPAAGKVIIASPSTIPTAVSEGGYTYYPVGDSYYNGIKIDSNSTMVEYSPKHIYYKENKGNNEFKLVSTNAVSETWPIPAGTAMYVPAMMAAPYDTLPDDGANHEYFFNLAQKAGFYSDNNTTPILDWDGIQLSSGSSVTIGSVSMDTYIKDINRYENGDRTEFKPSMSDTMAATRYGLVASNVYVKEFSEGDVVDVYLGTKSEGTDSSVAFVSWGTPVPLPRLSTLTYDTGSGETAVTGFSASDSGSKSYTVEVPVGTASVTLRATAAAGVTIDEATTVVDLTEDASATITVTTLKGTSTYTVNFTGYEFAADTIYNLKSHGYQYRMKTPVNDDPDSLIVVNFDDPTTYDVNNTLVYGSGEGDYYSDFYTEFNSTTNNSIVVNRGISDVKNLSTNQNVFRYSNKNSIKFLRDSNSYFEGATIIRDFYSASANAVEDEYTYDISTGEWTRNSANVIKGSAYQPFYSKYIEDWLEFYVSSGCTVFVTAPYDTGYGGGVWPNAPEDWTKNTTTSFKLDNTNTFYYKHYNAGSTVKIPNYGSSEQWREANPTSLLYDPSVYIVVWDSTGETNPDLKAKLSSLKYDFGAGDLDVPGFDASDMGDNTYDVVIDTHDAISSIDIDASAVYGVSVSAPASVTVTDGEATAVVTATLGETTSTYTVNFIINLIVGANLTVAVDGDAGASVEGAIIGTRAYDVGTAFEVTAVPSEGYEFKYWIDAISNRIVSEDATYSFTLGATKSIEAKFVSEEDTTKTVIFKNKNGRIFLETIDSEDSITAPEAVYMGYTFTTWTKDGVDDWYAGVTRAYDDLAAGTSTYDARYTKNEDRYTVNVTNGVIKDTSETTGSYLYDTKVTVTTDDEDFKYWTKNGQIVSYDSEYSFYVSAETINIVAQTLTVERRPIIMLTASIVEKAIKTKYALFAERNVNGAGTFIESGIIIGNSEDVDLDTYTQLGISTSTNGKGQFTVRKSVAEGSTYYAKAYMVYRDSSGIVRKVYSNSVVLTYEE